MGCRVREWPPSCLGRADRAQVPTGRGGARGPEMPDEGTWLFTLLGSPAPNPRLFLFVLQPWGLNPGPLH